jgi:hypothetical protein
LHDQNTIKNNNFTSSPGMIPVAASKQAPEIRACFRNSGLGASPSLPFGSDPITLKYLHGQKHPFGCQTSILELQIF